MQIVLAALLACLVLTTAVAQEEQVGAADEPTARLFDLGMTALELAERTDNNAERRELYDKATQAFRAILVNRPDLVRVRLELARVFFLKGQDGLARRHFEAVLAGGVPVPVAANIQRFLAIMQGRKRLTGYFGLAVAPDSNLNAASESEIIIHRHGVRSPALYARGGFRRRVRIRPVGLERRRIPATGERAA